MVDSRCRQSHECVGTLQMKLHKLVGVLGQGAEGQQVNGCAGRGTETQQVDGLSY